MTYDGVPCLGWAPGVENLLLATGHGMLGMSLAPGTGKLIAELAGGGPTSLDPAKYSVERFSGRRAG
jgi:D-amino-acid dehydrogenase